ncbi:MAG TPA: ATP-binding protein [Dongiaceae bacterium]|nr:ATP-binding protein [Dongiaceae bacterium]
MTNADPGAHDHSRDAIAKDRGLKVKIPRDTMVLRFAAATVAVILATLAMVTLLIAFGGAWVRPPIERTGLPQWGTGVVRVIEAAPASVRQALSTAASTDSVGVDWYAAQSPFAASADRDAAAGRPPDSIVEAVGEGHRKVVLFKPAGPTGAMLASGYDPARYPDLRFVAVKLSDGSWIVFTALAHWGINVPTRAVLLLTILALAIIAVSFLAARHLSRPIAKLVEALRLFGLDPQAPPIPEAGPRELREIIRTFNAMQAQIQTFIAYRTTMLAAISHDLRTPLTRLRLRGELIEDEAQRAKLFRDVDEMHAMVDAALAFFRDDVSEEAMTMFDLPMLLVTIINDYADQDITVAYAGPARASCYGRPFALKRAITNLIDNAVKYATPPEVALFGDNDKFAIAICDSGPGIPVQSMDRVFDPYYRVDRSRSRATGGVGLGLTAARSIVRGHGGEIVLRNRAEGGLEVMIMLPIIKKSANGAP